MNAENAARARIALSLKASRRHEISPTRALPLSCREVKSIPSQWDMEGEINSTVDKEATVRWALSQIEPKLKDVIEQRFGFRGRNRTLREIAEMWNVTPERARQIEARALSKLHEPEVLKRLRSVW